MTDYKVDKFFNACLKHVNMLYVLIKFFVILIGQNNILAHLFKSWLGLDGFNTTK